LGLEAEEDRLRYYLKALWGGIGGLILLILFALIAFTMDGK
jgi:hypothetical protein